MYALIAMNASNPGTSHNWEVGRFDSYAEAEAAKKDHKAADAAAHKYTTVYVIERAR